MTGRRRERFGLLVALVIPVLVAGCSSTPETELDWGVRDAPVRDSYTRTDTSRTDYARPAYTRSSYTPSSYTPARTYCPCAEAVPTPRPRPAWYKPDPAPRDTEAYNESSERFVWPMRGRILSDYGATASGGRNDGINIAATTGEPIRAAAGGVVSYAGDDLKSYGNLALIKHNGDYVTAYAHAERFIVRRGERVSKGQVIGYAGSTGDVRSPQLHFEIRRGVSPVDPMTLLGRQEIASR